jgi:hypothetical protein
LQLVRSVTRVEQVVARKTDEEVVPAEAAYPIDDRGAAKRCAAEVLVVRSLGAVDVEALSTIFARI